MKPPAGLRAIRKLKPESKKLSRENNNNNNNNTIKN